MTTTAPSADRTKAIAATVNPSDIALSLRKPRFSCSPYTMLSVSNSAFIAAFALQSEIDKTYRESEAERLVSL